MRRRHAFLALALPGLALLAFGAAPASAAVTQVHHVTALPVQAGTVRMLQAANTPASLESCGFFSGAWAIYGSGCSSGTPYSCKSGSQGSLAFRPSYISNDCTVRVWLYTGNGRTGTSLCVNPRTADNYLHTAYHYAWVSDNNADC
jgi:hypothetical protein